ncbi:hypothetical protein Goklo_004431 [Gossypium klotzschianum]|uniref:Pentatricopeptide repeat-containing protein n=1 Tax=Gossypium klotzschianum TaxID=34286 RepID=A0A7J8VPA5_9ROSI|nr:hypothetical protein [Gossypium klotzschianum]
MIQRYPKPSIVEFTKLLAAIAVSMCQIDLGFSVLGNMLKLGVEPHVTFSTLMQGKISQAVRLFDEMVENGYQPNLIVYSTNSVKPGILIELSGF